MKVLKHSFRIFSYAQEGLLSSGNVGEGRFIPYVVLDLKDDLDIIDLINAHDSIVAGDTTMTWTREMFNSEDFIFKMEFTKPMHVIFGIRFNIEKDHSLIDSIIQSKGLYLLLGKKGEKISGKLKGPGILLEVPDMGIQKIWHKALKKTLLKTYRRNGFTKSEASDLIEKHIISMREFWKIRI